MPLLSLLVWLTPQVLRDPTKHFLIPTAPWPLHHSPSHNTKCSSYGSASLASCEALRADLNVLLPLYFLHLAQKLGRVEAQYRVYDLKQPLLIRCI